MRISIDHIWWAVAENCAANQEESCALCSRGRRAFWTLIVKCLLFNKCPDLFYLLQLTDLSKTNFTMDNVRLLFVNFTWTHCNCLDNFLYSSSMNYRRCLAWCFSLQHIFIIHLRGRWHCKWKRLGIVDKNISFFLRILQVHL